MNHSCVWCRRHTQRSKNETVVNGQPQQPSEYEEINMSQTTQQTGQYENHTRDNVQKPQQQSKYDNIGTPLQSQSINQYESLKRENVQQQQSEYDKIDTPPQSQSTSQYEILKKEYGNVEFAHGGLRTSSPLNDKNAYTSLQNFNVNYQNIDADG